MQLLLSLFLAAAHADTTLKFQLLDSQPGQKLTFQAPEGHHFNREAPNMVVSETGKKKTLPSKLEVIKDKIETIWAAKTSPCDLRAIFFVCDNSNTYCVPIKQRYSCSDGKLSMMPWEESSAPARQESSRDTLFSTNADEAYKISAEKHKSLLIDFAAIWCPPCNQLDELVFKSPGFKKAVQKFTALRVDPDDPKNWKLKNRYKVRFYPTVILADENGDEISRLVGFFPSAYFISEMNKSLKQKSLEKKISWLTKKMISMQPMM